MTIEPLTAMRAEIGESPTWVAHQRALYWVDVKAPALHRLDIDTGALRSWQVTSDLGAFALLPDGAALVALRQGLHRLDLESGSLELLTPPPYDPTLFRFNEGACDLNGRFWVGVMFDPLDADASPRPGRLHSYTLQGGLREEPDASELHNGMAWSADWRTFFVSHTYAGEIFAFDFEPQDGRLSNRRLFATIPKAHGIPDGAAIDVEGGYWCALHGGNKLRRFNQDGSPDRDLTLPVSQPTMCAFAGDDLTTMYVSSASSAMSPEQKQREPMAGALMRVNPGARGIARLFAVR